MEVHFNVRTLHHPCSCRLPVVIDRKFFSRFDLYPLQPLLKTVSLNVGLIIAVFHKFEAYV
jgi:hypothetical protein